MALAGSSFTFITLNPMPGAPQALALEATPHSDSWPRPRRRLRLRLRRTRWPDHVTVLNLFQDGGLQRGRPGHDPLPAAAAAAAATAAGRLEALAAGKRGAACGGRGIGRHRPQPPHAVSRTVPGQVRLLRDPPWFLQ